MSDRRRMRRWLAYLAIGLAMAAWALAGRPRALGGQTGYVMVSGVSMQPTYHSGDLVVTRARRDYRIGDIVAYKIPRGQMGAGVLVIHRIIGATPGDGYTLQGDNNAHPDKWHPGAGDIVGEAWLHVPEAGKLLAALRAPLPLASLAAGTVLAMLLVPPDRRKPSRA